MEKNIMKPINKIMAKIRDVNKQIMLKELANSYNKRFPNSTGYKTFKSNCEYMIDQELEKIKKETEKGPSEGVKINEEAKENAPKQALDQRDLETAPPDPQQLQAAAEFEQTGNNLHNKSQWLQLV